jgi:hypothetical protein
MFGLDKEQTKQASDVLKVLGEEWRDLVAGREGFLVDKKRAGLLGQKVVWGEMDSMVCLPLLKRDVGVLSILTYGLKFLFIRIKE